MANRQMVTFHEVLSQHFPVCVSQMFLKKCFRVVGHVVTFDQVFDATLSGFMIRGSTDDAGVCIIGGNPLVSNNIITGNSNGVRLSDGSTAVICGNRIRNNW